MGIVLEEGAVEVVLLYEREASRARHKEARWCVNIP